MVDPGATHNFISLRAIEELGVPVSAAPGFGVSLGDGKAVRGEGVCKGVQLIIGDGVLVVEDFLPLQLGNSNVILGVQWLEKLGSVVTNWKTQIMKYEEGGSTVILKGDPSLTRSRISLKAMIRVMRKEGGGILVECNQMEEKKTVGVETTTPLFLGSTLAEFQEVFALPTGCRLGVAMSTPLS